MPTDQANSFQTNASTGAAVAQIASSQIGNGPHKYCSWYGVPDSTEWCDIFESWCQYQNGSLAVSGGKQSYTPTHATWFRAHGLWHTGSAGAIPGDVMFFATDGGSGFGSISHVGIVTQSTSADGTAHSVAGNTGNGLVAGETWSGGLNVIGYGRPNYANGAGANGIPDDESTSAISGLVSPILDLMNLFVGSISLKALFARVSLVILGSAVMLIGLKTFASPG